MINLINISKEYKDSTPLKDIDLNIEYGDFVSITGPSGSGKTTLLNITAGLLKPTCGQVKFDSVSIYDLNQSERVNFRRKNFGFVFQSFNLISYLTVLQNVEVSLYLTGRNAEDQKKTAIDSLGTVGLTDKYDKYPSELSMGEQQRIAIARAVANNPRIVFADEPTGNLDMGNKKIILEYFNKLNKVGVTVLLVTHDQEIADQAKRKIKLNEGRLL